MEIVLFIVIMCIAIITYLYLNNKRNAEMFILKSAIDFSNIGILALNKKGEIIIENTIMFNFRNENNIDDNYIENFKKICNQTIGTEYIYWNK